jgi:putative ABC transport system ATP-binding protein
MHSMSNSERTDQLIELCAVTKLYPVGAGEFRALEHVDLVIPAGEFVAVVGKSGSGKSTLINLITGIDRPTAGTVHVGGTPVHSLGESGLALWRGRTVGIVFQSFQLLPTLTALENVMLPMDFAKALARPAAHARALTLLAQMGIADQAAKLPSALSAGQQQRAAIARALANDPPIIVADEPTGNLDTHTAEVVLGLLKSLTERGKSVVMVTHERDVARRVDRVIHLVDGRVQDISAGGARSGVAAAQVARV